MKIETKFHGTKNYEDKEVLIFKKGVPGFEHLRKFILFPIEENNLFSVLHSVEDERVGIVVVSPFEIEENYEFKLEDNLVEKLNIKETSDVMVLNTVTLSSKVKNITVNLKAPIIINIKERLGEQIILDKENYKVKHPLMQE